MPFESSAKTGRRSTAFVEPHAPATGKVRSARSQHTQVSSSNRQGSDQEPQNEVWAISRASA